MLPPRSPCVMPSRSVARPALKPASVMSFAYCMFAISAGDLNIRQPAVIGVARTTCDAGDALASAVGDEEAHALFDADLRGRDAAVFQDAADQRHRVLVFLPDADVVRELDDFARALLLEAGRHVGDSPFAGMTSRNGRSLRPHRTLTKYDMLVPPSSTIAPMPCSVISRCAFAMRARRSSSAIGGAGLGSGFSARIDAGNGIPPPAPRPCADDRIVERVAAALAAADAWTNVRRVTRMMRGQSTRWRWSCSQTMSPASRRPCRSVLIQRRPRCRLNYGQMPPLRRRLRVRRVRRRPHVLPVRKV